MKRILFTMLVLVICSNPLVSLAKSSFESQIVDALEEESSKGSVKVGIMDFSVSTIGDSNISADNTEKIKKEMIAALETGVMKEIKRRSLKQKISLVERSRLLDILNEQNLSLSGLTEKTATSIGGIAGLDVIIWGSMSITDEKLNFKAKLVRVKDATIADVIEDSTTLPKEPQVLIDGPFKVAHSEMKVFGWDFSRSETTLSISFQSDMVINVYVFDEANYKRYSAGQAASVIMSNKNLTHGKFAVKLPTAGTYYLALENQKELLMRADVVLTVTEE